MSKQQGSGVISTGYRANKHCLLSDYSILWYTLQHIRSSVVNTGGVEDSEHVHVWDSSSWVQSNLLVWEEKRKPVNQPLPALLQVRLCHYWGQFLFRFVTHFINMTDSYCGIATRTEKFLAVLDCLLEAVCISVNSTKLFKTAAERTIFGPAPQEWCTVCFHCIRAINVTSESL